MRDLKLVDNRLYIAGLGTPQDIVVSEDTKSWYLVHVEGFDSRFNMHVEVDEGNIFIACAAKRNFIVIDKDGFNDMFVNQRLVMISYSARMERLMGLAFILKRKLLPIGIKE